MSRVKHLFYDNARNKVVWCTPDNDKHVRGNGRQFLIATGDNETPENALKRIRDKTPFGQTEGGRRKLNELITLVQEGCEQVCR